MKGHLLKGFLTTPTLTNGIINFICFILNQPDVAAEYGFSVVMPFGYSNMWSSFCTIRPSVIL